MESEGWNSLHEAAIRVQLQEQRKLQAQSKSKKFTYAGAGEGAPESVQQAIEDFHKLPESIKETTPLLYYILGSGTPPYKMTREDSEYTDKSQVDKHTCGNCTFTFRHVASKAYICSQIRDEIVPAGWCNQWSPSEQTKKKEH